jgi:arginase
MNSNNKTELRVVKNRKFTNNTVSVIGVSVKEGQQLTGVEQSPALFRKGGLLNAIKDQLGYKISDHGDLTKEELHEAIEAEEQCDKAYKYVLPNIEVLGCMNKRLAEQCQEYSARGDFVLTLGGDHGLASGSIQGMLQTHENLKVIWIDAHGDCNTPETSPSGNYHGMPVAHLLGWIPEGSMKSFDWLVPQLKPENIVFIGLRDLDEGEKKLLKKHDIKVYTPYDIEAKGGIANVMDEALAYLEADEKDSNPIHISWDVDGCDPSFLKATGTKSRCGLSERESHFILRRCAGTGNLVSLDMVEVNPELEEKEDEEREVLHGDNPSLKGSPTVVYAMEFILSALGDTWL